MKKLQLKQGIPNKYDRHCLSLTNSEINDKLKSNIPYVIRMKVLYYFIIIFILG